MYKIGDLSLQIINQYYHHNAGNQVNQKRIRQRVLQKYMQKLIL